MGGKRPVVIYGASGFSGRLVAEFLREYNVPFIAAGRNRAKIQDVMNHVPGIEMADYEIAEVGSSVDDLTKAFTGARVVCITPSIITDFFKGISRGSRIGKVRSKSNVSRDA